MVHASLPLSDPPQCGSTPPPCTQGHSGTDGDDLLPGVCMLSQRWLEEAVLSGFGQADDHKGVDKDEADLAAWFEDGRVRFYLQVIQGAKGCV